MAEKQNSATNSKAESVDVKTIFRLCHFNM